MTVEALLLAQQSTSWPAWRADLARSIPAVGRALGIYRGLIAQMPLQRFRAAEALPTTRLLERPDEERPRSWFVGQHVDDYLVHGNAVHLVLNRDADGWPQWVRWLPAPRVSMAVMPDPMARPEYLFDGRPLPQEDVVHVQRGADPTATWRGVGVVEQHLLSMGRVFAQEASETASLTGAGVPSVAVIAPNPRISDDEIKAARAQWDELYGGPRRVPGIFPQGTEIRTLAWSPTDSQMTEARTLALTDVANMFNVDAYHLGAPGSSHTYRSPGPLFTSLLRVSLEPVMADFEGEWSYRWLPRGQELRFLRRVVEQDTLAEGVSTVAKAIGTVDANGEPLMLSPEGRTALGWAVSDGALQATAVSPLPTTGGAP